MNSRTKQYEKLRKEILKETQDWDGRWFCEARYPYCEYKTEHPTLDHKKKRSSHPELLLERSNIWVLCPKCDLKETNSKP